MSTKRGKNIINQGVTFSPVKFKIHENEYLSIGKRFSVNFSPEEMGKKVPILAYLRLLISEDFQGLNNAENE